MISPGSIEFRNHILKTIPQEGGEQRAQYLERAARTLKMPPRRLHDLFYDLRTEISVQEHQAIFGQSPNLNRLDDAKNRDQYINHLIQEQAHDIAAQAMRKFAEGILESLPRSHG